MVEGDRVGSERYRVWCGSPLVSRLMKNVYIVAILFEKRIEYDHIPSIVSGGHTCISALDTLGACESSFSSYVLEESMFLGNAPAFRPTQWERDGGNEQGMMGLVWVMLGSSKLTTFFPGSVNPLAIILK